MAGIIKSGVWHEVGGTTPISFNFEDMSCKADNYLDSIRSQATQILTQAKERVAAIEAEARERGRQAAIQQATQLAQQHLDTRLQSLLPALEKSITAIQHSRETWLRHWNKTPFDWRWSIAERLIRKELSKAPEISLDWIREALEYVTGEARVTLHLNPADYETLGEQAQQLLDRLTKLGAATISPNPMIEPGGCQVVTDFGSIDNQLTSQLQRIQDELTG